MFQSKWYAIVSCWLRRKFTVCLSIYCWMLSCKYLCLDCFVVFNDCYCQAYYSTTKLSLVVMKQLQTCIVSACYYFEVGYFLSSYLTKGGCIHMQVLAHVCLVQTITVVCTVLLYMLLLYTCPFNHCSIDSTYTVEEAVEKLGFGSFQLLVTVFSGLLWVSD